MSRTFNPESRFFFELTLYLRDTVTGICGEYCDEVALDTSFDHCPFAAWEDGRLACDCNRSRMLYGDTGRLPCGRGRIVIDAIIETEAGGVLWREVPGGVPKCTFCTDARDPEVHRYLLEMGHTEEDLADL